MILALLYAAAAETPPDEAGNFVATLFTQVITTGVIAALITTTAQIIVGRRNSRIQERKNAIDAESDLVTRYKDAASEERAAKESAVRTIKDLLAASEVQVASLKSTVVALNETIQQMSSISDSQKGIILRLETERDRLEAERISAEKLRDEKIEELRLAQVEILELTRSHAEAERRAKDTFGI